MDYRLNFKQHFKLRIEMMCPILKSESLITSTSIRIYKVFTYLILIYASPLFYTLKPYRYPLPSESAKSFAQNHSETTTFSSNRNSS